MTSNSIHRVSIPGIGMLLLWGVVGCSAGASPEPSPQTTSGVVQDQLSWSGFCGGHDGHECSDDKVCVSFLSRSCPGPEHVGLCIHRPKHCETASDPVCGCDGVTYGNLCEAASAGASIVHRGACKPPPACGSGGKACPGAGTCVRTSTGDGDADDDGHGPIWGHWGGHHDDDGTSACQCNVAQQCKAGERWNDSPAVCACETNPDPCAGVTCHAGDVCVAHSDGTATCAPDPCTGVTCRTGEVCVVPSNGTAACVPDACVGVTCKAGQSCVVLPDGSATCH